MPFFTNTWLVLEAREEDISIPYSPKRTLNPLLERRIKAAEQLVPKERLLLMLTDHSCAYVGSECRNIAPNNILIHPSQCGNAVPFANCLLEIRRLKPNFCVIFIPSGNAYYPIPELHFALQVAFHSLGNDRAKVFLIQSLLQRESNALVVGSVPALLALYMASAPQFLKPLKKRAEIGKLKSLDGKEKLDLPKGDLYEDVLSVNQVFLRRLPISSSVIPGPIHRAGMLGPSERLMQPTFH